MGEVVDLSVVTKLDIPPEKILRKAIEKCLTTVLVIGWDAEGELYFAASSPDGGDALWLIEKAKKRLLEIGD